MIINEANFQEEVLSCSEPVLIDFWAPWCRPCNQMTPVLEELSTQFKVGKVNVDENKGLSKQYRISAIPALLVFKDGKVVEQMVGIRSKPVLAVIMSKHQ